MFHLLLLAFGVLAGVTTVLFGFGGGFVAVPLLYALLTSIHGADSAVGQAAMHIAVATSTCVMIFGASMATLRQHRAGALPWDQVRPLAGYIAVGAVAGAAVATWLNGDWVRWAFIAYLALTIADALLRRASCMAPPLACSPWAAGQPPLQVWRLARLRPSWAWAAA